MWIVFLLMAGFSVGLNVEEEQVFNGLLLF